MRSALYTAIKDRLEATDLIKHIDLWNNQTDTLEVGSLFPLPAVFIEFAPINWGRQARGQARGDMQVSLHIITRAEPWQSDCKPVADPLDYLAFVEEVQSCIIGLSGMTWSALQPVASETDHSYRELRHSIESFVCQGIGLIQHKGQKTTIPVQLVLHGDNQTKEV